MNKPSTKRSQKSLPRLERLLLDTDVNAYVERYLAAVGFDVVFAAKVDVDITDDTAILKWARRRRRIMVCHDKHRDGQTRVKLFTEVYDNGGKAIRIGGKPDQHPLTSLGKILVHRRDWLAFFKDNEGMVLVHGTGMKKMPRQYLLRQFQAVWTEPAIPEKRRYSSAPRRRKTTPPEQIGMPGVSKI